MTDVKYIAEIGINHNGDIDIAKQLIKQSKAVGFDFVKFQKRTLETCIRDEKKQNIRSTPWGDMSYMDYKKRLEFGKEEYDIIDAYCKEIGIEWFASAWDYESLLFLRQYNLKTNKVASAMIKNLDFLEAVAKEGKYTYLSTGMCEMDDIQKAVDIFNHHGCPYLLMHTVSVYPCPHEDCNIKMISTLQEKFGYNVGYSGHESGILPSVLAVSLGAKAIERHVTLNRTMWGTDQSASLELKGQELLIRDCNHVAEILGDGKKTYPEAEKKVSKALRWYL